MNWEFSSCKYRLDSLAIPKQSKALSQITPGPVSNYLSDTLPSVYTECHMQHLNERVGEM